MNEKEFPSNARTYVAGHGGQTSRIARRAAKKYSLAAAVAAYDDGRFARAP